MTDDVLDRPWEPADGPTNGARVRVRLNDECLFAPGVPRHAPETHGRMGMVYDLITDPKAHGYLVRFESPYLADGRWHRAGQFARSELERVGPFDYGWPERDPSPPA